MLFPRVSRPMTIIERYTAYENSKTITAFQLEYTGWFGNTGRRLRDRTNILRSSFRIIFVNKSDSFGSLRIIRFLSLSFLKSVHNFRENEFKIDSRNPSYFLAFGLNAKPYNKIFLRHWLNANGKLFLIVHNFEFLACKFLEMLTRISELPCM